MVRGEAEWREAKKDEEGEEERMLRLEGWPDNRDKGVSPLALGMEGSAPISLRSVMSSMEEEPRHA
jgi:hypothetical protein